MDAIWFAFGVAVSSGIMEIRNAVTLAPPIRAFALSRFSSRYAILSAWNFDEEATFLPNMIEAAISIASTNITTSLRAEFYLPDNDFDLSSVPFLLTNPSSVNLYWLV